ncbi:hypothetical protein WICMUC_001201 [Wickerhamomyces mucosus]|uniref:Uncharacterized protein n=1 Tax=Wickerhamomyces mucosus TaxID=1378264 RepID=A0A9P8THP4_9ASCO|nr:hypothetical protein WICMUC_001201 [Wickerhamomyces mucosus]
MTSNQSNIAPVVNNNQLDIVTLKNIVALDLIEQNELILKSFNLLDDSKRKVTLGRTDINNIEFLQQKLKITRKDIEEIGDLKEYRNSLQDKNSDLDTELLKKLSQDFKSDTIFQDSEILQKEYELRHNIKSIIDETRQGYRTVKFSEVHFQNQRQQQPEQQLQQQQQPSINQNDALVQGSGSAQVNNGTSTSNL